VQEISGVAWVVLQISGPVHQSFYDSEHAKTASLRKLVLLIIFIALQPGPDHRRLPGGEQSVSRGADEEAADLGDGGT